MLDIKILFENEEVLVVNKPAGLMVHPDGRADEPTLTDWVLEKYTEMKDVGEPARYSGVEIARPGIVHRLDRDTSGVLVLAKTQESFLNLKEQFKERKIEKIYNAFVYGALKDEEGIIDRPIGKSRSDFRKWSAQRGARGVLRGAVTHYRVLKKNKELTYVEVSPETGRTHQIRVHFKAINHPVVCDTLYAPKHVCELGFDRVALHARLISFSLLNGDSVTVEAELPEDFRTALNFL